MADNRDNQLNLAALQRLDNNISSIVDSASQVALYKFSSDSNEWEKTEIEGTLFVCKRAIKPHHGLIVMNRVSTTNFIEPITSEIEFQVQTPFLLYRNYKGFIHGIWFYEQEQCKKVGGLIKGILQSTNDKKTVQIEKPMLSSPRHRQKGNPDNLDKMDIMSLLSRAQEEYDKRSLEKKTPSSKTDNGPQRSGILKPTPVRANGLKLSNGSAMPITVDKLFAQVGDGKHVFKENNGKHCDNLARSRSYSSAHPNQESKDSKLQNAENILQKLLSSTINASEPEKQTSRRGHRARSATYSSEPFTLDNQTSVEMVEQDLKKKLNMLPNCETVNKDMKAKSYFRSESLQDSGTVSRTQAVDIPILTPAMLELSSSLPTSSELPFGTHSQAAMVNDSFVASSFPLSMLPKPPSPTPLLSPMDFKVSIKNSSSSLDETPPSPPELRASLINSGLQCFGDDDVSEELLLPQTLMQSSNSAKKQSTNPLGYTPLTKNQLREALGYMIQNDDEFISQLHECYLKSLRRHLNGHKSS